ncbi:hypothetical protein KAR91_37125 [Candidatus Pacearchaeota archaeon]|nr:hypothetical protein [Candidatus Pacearchaeota archaeon]
MLLSILIFLIAPGIEVRDGLPDISDILEQIDYGYFDERLSLLLHKPGNEEKQVIDLKVALAESLHAEIHSHIDPWWPEEPERKAFPKYLLAVATVSMFAFFFMSTGVVSNG